MVMIMVIMSWALYLGRPVLETTRRIEETSCTTKSPLTTTVPKVSGTCSVADFFDQQHVPHLTPICSTGALYVYSQTHRGREYRGFSRRALGTLGVYRINE